jgi:hypothetical protein
MRFIALLHRMTNYVKELITLDYPIIMHLEVSLADGLDRLTILEIKYSRITCPNKLKEIQKEIDALHEFIPYKQLYEFQYKLLLYTNLQVWESMDKVNSIEMESRNTIDFAKLAAKVYDYNDQRFRIKRLINTISNSALKEQKSYGSKHVIVTVDDVDNCISVINYLSVRYDSVSFSSEYMDRLKNIFTTPNFIYEPVDSTFTISADTFELPDRSAYEFTPITYLASGLLGDFIHQLSVVNEKYQLTGRKGVIYMTDAIEPFRWGLERTYADIRPFLLTQSYIHDLRIHDGTTCEINLSKWRYDMNFMTDSWHSIFKRNYDIEWSKTPWFKLQGNSEYNNTIFISTSPNRWWQEPFDCSMLVSQLGPDVRFLASEKSNYDHFVSKTGVTLPLVNPSDFTELVCAIQGCKLFVGTLSAPLAVADALHKKRIALQQDDNDGLIASKTNSSFLTYKHHLSNLI